MRPLESFHDIARLPLSQWRDRFPNHRPLGIYNAYVPEEIFAAAGLTPIYLFHRSDNRGQARVHLPSFACWPGRSLVDQALAGELAGLAGIAFAQTCDMVQALTDICRKAAPQVPVYHVGMPAHLATRAARRYLVAELQRLCQALGGLSEGALRQACSLYHRTRELMARLYDRAGELSPGDLYATLRAGLLMPKEIYNRELAQLLEALPATPFHGPRLILVGPHLADPVLYQVVQDAGARFVDDLLDVGHRYFASPGKRNGDPIVNLVERLLEAPPTPTKHHPARRRDHYLVELAGQKQADGIIFARQKFCDPHGFDYAALGPALDEAGIPHLLVELEQSAQLGQLRTRVQAFLETLAQHSPSRPESVK
jgi:benzoyl-CoA reductase/2-hydroxyglutaryl-CoA dehydratase subunit BcrC/BadD/HgdB